MQAGTYRSTGFRPWCSRQRITGSDGVDERAIIQLIFAGRWGMDSFTSGLTVLSAMITPAVLISACGSLILSTSTRLGLVVDRVRESSNQFETMARDHVKDQLIEGKRAMSFYPVDRLTT